MNEREAGMRTRQEVLGSEYVERALGQAGAFAAPFQELLTRYAWGSVWSRPELDRRTRSAITLMALVCVRAEDELAVHVRAAVRNGLTVQEICEVLLQSAIYAGVPAANAAFAVAGDVLRTEGLIE